MKQQKRIKGVLSPVVTPFKADLSPDPQRFIAHCHWLLSQNCGLAVFGTNSEANSLSVDERMALLDALVAAGVDTSRMMPGTGCCSITDTVRAHRARGQARLRRRADAAAVLLQGRAARRASTATSPRWCSASAMRGCASTSITSRRSRWSASRRRWSSACSRPIPTAIAGMKDSSGDWNNTKALLDAFAKSGFDVFAGSESFLLANMRNGGAGCISATANVNPAAIDKLYREWKNPDADAQQAALNAVRTTVGAVRDDPGAEAGGRALRERPGLGHGAPAAGRA